MIDKNGQEINIGDVVKYHDNPYYHYKIISVDGEKVRLKVIAANKPWGNFAIGQILYDTKNKLQYYVKIENSLKCECGGEKSNTTHSNWCPMFG